jgi:integrase
MIMLTDKIITQPVTKRRRLFDIRCDGFHADITPSSISFRLKVWNAAAGKQDVVSLGRYNPETFTTEIARKAAFRLKGQGGDVAARAKNAVAASVRNGVTFNQAADEYIAWAREEIELHNELRPRIKAWKDSEGYLRAARAAFGDRALASVTASEIVALLKTYTDRRKIAGANKVRTTLFSLFRFSAEAGREYVTSNPCSILPRREKTAAKDRFLTQDEIRVLWHGIDHPDAPCQRRVGLAFKLILATALRPGEVITAQKSEIGNIKKERGGDGLPAYRIPAPRVKKSRVIVQPLNSLALEIIEELKALDAPGTDLFPSGRDGAPLVRALLAETLNGKVQVSRAGKKYRQPGLLKFLGFTKRKGEEFAPFTSHDLRRTASTQLGLDENEDGSKRYTKLDTGRILDHQDTTGAETTKVYDVSEHVQQTKLRRPVLNRWDVLLRQFIGQTPASNVVKLKVA